MGRGGIFHLAQECFLNKVLKGTRTHTLKLHNTFLLVLHFLPHQYRWHVQSLYLLGP